MTGRFLNMVIAFAFTACTTSLCVAQKVGTTSLQFLKVMPGARAAAMGEAFASVVKGVDGVFWNPAAIARVEGHEVSLTQVLWIFDTKQNALGYAFPLGDWGNVGAQVQFTDIGAIEETRADQLKFVGAGTDLRYNPGLTGQSFTPISWVAGLTYAQSLTDRFATGLTAKYVYESLWSSGSATVVLGGQSQTYKTYASGILLDFGMRYETGFRTVVMGASVQNFGPPVQFAKDRFPAPLLFRLGISSYLLGQDALLMEDENSRFLVSYDILQPNDYDQQMHVGMEYEFGEMFALRGGHKLNYDEDRWTLGGGVRTEFSGLFFSLDYSYGNMGTYLGQVHRLSLGVLVK